MAKHHDHSNKCTTVRVPPLQLWHTTEAVAFPNDSKYGPVVQSCCGATAQMQLYNKACNKFCNTNGNQTEVADCMTKAGVKKVQKYNNENGGKDTGAAPLSKPALGLILMIFGSLVAGTM